MRLSRWSDFCFVYAPRILEDHTIVVNVNDNEACSDIEQEECVSCIIET